MKHNATARDMINGLSPQMPAAFFAASFASRPSNPR